jgi:hypothetical protein
VQEEEILNSDRKTTNYIEEKIKERYTDKDKNKEKQQSA